MTPMAAKFIKEHKFCAWNTGRGYSSNGQRIIAVELKSGNVYFYDIDRQIDGVTLMPITRAYLNTQEFVMHAYDYMHYSYGGYKVKEEYPHLGWEGVQAITSVMRAAAVSVGGSENEPVSQTGIVVEVPNGD